MKGKVKMRYVVLAIAILFVLILTIGQKTRDDTIVLEEENKDLEPMDLNYGFISGVRDGMFIPVNIVLTLVIDKSLTADHNGIISTPANDEYWVGFLLASGGEFGFFVFLFVLLGDIIGFGLLERFL